MGLKTYVSVCLKTLKTSTTEALALNSPLQKLLEEWVEALGAVISGIVWVDKR